MPGEQYRFHVDMGQCIGCKCCVVACNEQNGNPAAINWRRVGEIEGGWYPRDQRSYLSMGCNHCLEPTCLEGCPVDAYTKDPLTGIVRHSADACIGCQYCTWNCSYGVPQYNPERGVVGKCDMCHGRLSLGQAPACVSACPEGAHAIEIVNVAEWRASVDVERSRAPGCPSDDGSLSTTRVTLPDDLPPNARPRDITHVTPEQPHWSLDADDRAHAAVGRRVRHDLAAAAARRDDAAGHRGADVAAVGGLALAAATLHLGRPAHAYRALKMWRRSWLSREVLLFAAFSAWPPRMPGCCGSASPAARASAASRPCSAFAGVTASACIYRVPSRARRGTRRYTLLQFNLTAAILGPLFAAAAVGRRHAVAGVGAASMAGGAGRASSRCDSSAAVASDSLELQRHGAAAVHGAARHAPGSRRAARARRHRAAAARRRLAEHRRARHAGGARCSRSRGEMLGRYLFFVSVVPKHMAAPYLAAASEAA